MEEQMQMQMQIQYPMAVTHLLQHTLRSLCMHDNSQWVYAVFWRILPRNYPPPKWDLPGSLYDRSRGNRRNWILVWEDGFCNFAASCDAQEVRGLQPELFFKMSHEIYNYGEGLIGKVASDHSHKWVSNEPAQDQEMNFLSSWHNPADSHPRTWEAQFQCGIKTIALIAVREGVVQLGAINNVAEDLNYVVLLRKKFGYLESIPGVLLPHPSSSPFPLKLDDIVRCNNTDATMQAATNADAMVADQYLGYHHSMQSMAPMEMLQYNGFHLGQHPQLRITPSMSSLEALLSKLPAVGPAAAPSPSSSTAEKMVVAVPAKEEMEEDEEKEEGNRHEHEGIMAGLGGGDQGSNSIIYPTGL